MNNKNKILPQNKQNEQYDILYNEFEQLKYDFSKLKNKIDQLNTKFTQFIDNVEKEKEIINDYSMINNYTSENDSNNQDNLDYDEEYYGSEEYKFRDSDELSDNDNNDDEIICKNMDPSLARMLGFPVDESLYKSDWIPPKISGLSNSDKIIDNTNKNII